MTPGKWQPFSPSRQRTWGRPRIDPRLIPEIDAKYRCRKWRHGIAAIRLRHVDVSCSGRWRVHIENRLAILADKGIEVDQRPDLLGNGIGYRRNDVSAIRVAHKYDIVE